MTSPAQMKSTGAAPVERWVAIATAKRRQFMIGAVSIVVIAGGFWFVRASRRNKIAFAARELRNAQSAVAAGNVPLAINDLGRIVRAYGGTAAAGEAALLLGQLRLERGETDLAITELDSFLEGRPEDRFRAPAHGLMGSALEQAGRFAEAGEAYRLAAETWPYSHLRAQSLLDAGRALRAAGDTAQAASAYERVLSDFADSPSALEAELRLAELRKRFTPQPTAANRR